MLKWVIANPVPGLTDVLTKLRSAILRAIEPVLHPRRYRDKKRAISNRDFLANLGFKEIGDGDLSYIDADGNPLRLVQSNQTQITFIVIGRRRSRAYIKLDKKGRYTSYTGPIKV